MADFQIVKTKDDTTYIKDGKMITFINNEKFDKIIDEVGIDFIFNKNIIGLYEIKDPNIYKKERSLIAFIKNINGKRFLLPINIGEFLRQEELISKNFETFKIFSAKDIFILLKDMKITQDHKVLVKAFCSLEEFTDKKKILLDDLKLFDSPKINIIAKIPLQMALQKIIDLASNEVEIIDTIVS